MACLAVGIARQTSETQSKTGMRLAMARVGISPGRTACTSVNSTIAKKQMDLEIVSSINPNSIKIIPSKREITRLDFLSKSNSSSNRMWKGRVVAIGMVTTDSSSKDSAMKEAEVPPSPRENNTPPISIFRKREASPSLSLSNLELESLTLVITNQVLMRVIIKEESDTRDKISMIIVT